jgi:hypothetical protein
MFPKKWSFYYQFTNLIMGFILPELCVFTDKTFIREWVFQLNTNRLCASLFVNSVTELWTNTTILININWNTKMRTIMINASVGGVWLKWWINYFEWPKFINFWCYQMIQLGLIYSKLSFKYRIFIKSSPINIFIKNIHNKHIYSTLKCTQR